MSEQEVRQTMITLPYLSDEVPALYLADGRPYIPVFAVCQVLGIPAGTHIQRWKNLALWATARKLPFQTLKRGKRRVWCLLISQVPFLYSLFNWNLVSPERRRQLRQATEEHLKLADLAYQDMQRQYKAIRQALFTFLVTFADTDALLREYAESLAPLLDSEASSLLNQLVEQGRVLFHDATAHARKMLQDQGALPVMDAIEIDQDHKVIDTFSMPLLPIVPGEDRDRFFEFMGLLSTWGQEITTFWKEQGFRPGKGS